MSESTTILKLTPLETREEAIRELQEEIALLTSYATDTIYRLRYDSMHYDYISPAVVRLLGYSPLELKEIGIRSLILETRIVRDTLEAVESFAPLEESRKRGEVHKWQADYRMRAKDGHMLWVSDISYPWYDESGAIIGSIGTLRDITERVEAETRTREEIERMANTDALTGMGNRRAFFERLEEELKRIRRTREEMALLLIDIDHFKKVNADFGEHIGDLVIHSVARMVQASLRETDFGARIEGQQFAVILPETPASGAYWVAERIRASVARHIFHFEGDEQLMGCTVSIGLAGAVPDEEVTASGLFSMADSRLYIAKHTGRNQVSMDEVMELH